jgi:hypothetical protein
MFCRGCAWYSAAAAAAAPKMCFFFQAVQSPSFENFAFEGDVEVFPFFCFLPVSNPHKPLIYYYYRQKLALLFIQELNFKRTPKMKFLGSKGHTALIYLPHMLAFASFGILLGGVAAMQNECGSGVNNIVLGQVHYLSSTSCDRFYSFDWFITFFQGFVWLVLLPVIVGRQIHKSRNMSTGLLIVASLLLINMTNVWYRAWSGIGDIPVLERGLLTDSYDSRAKVTFAGALVGAVANLLMIFLIGLHDEKDTEGRGGEQRQFQTSYVPTGAMPGATPTEPETSGYREGPVATESKAIETRY